MSKHTKGPWIVNGENSQGFKVVCRGPEVGWNIALVLPPPLDFKPMSKDRFNLEWEANARLISVAPDLLECLKEVIEDGLATNMASWQEKTAKAIAKAEGRAE